MWVIIIIYRTCPERSPRGTETLCEYIIILRIREIVEVKNIPSGHREIINETGFAYCFKLPDSGVVWPALEANLIQQAMAKTNGKLKEASQLLEISKDTLRYRIKKTWIINRLTILRMQCRIPEVMFFDYWSTICHALRNYCLYHASCGTESALI